MLRLLTSSSCLLNNWDLSLRRDRPYKSCSAFGRVPLSSAATQQARGRAFGRRSVLLHAKSASSSKS